MPEDPTPKIEYVKLWMQQSQLFWSRLQTTSVLHSGVLIGWYKLETDDKSDLKSMILLLGIWLSIFLIAIMYRDSQYMEAMKAKAKGFSMTNPNELKEDAFPHLNKNSLSGRACGYFIVATFPVVEIFLLGYKYGH